jgi:undecaprenyl-diphosphatase
MGWIEALILGIVQGLTEFLPVSSSGHLEIFKALLGDESLPQESLLFTVVVHAATALATVVVYRKDIVSILAGLFKFEWNTDTQFVVKIIVSMIPAAFIGLFFNDQIETLFNKNILLVGGMLVITGLLLLMADRAKRTSKNLSFANAFVVGIAQAIAILPGISRSGATIATTVGLGVDRERAARFSFLMVVPLIAGKMILDLKDLYKMGSEGASDQLWVLLIGFIAAFIAGIFACKWMIQLVKRAKLTHFAYYCFAIGIACSLYVILI